MHFQDWKPPLPLPGQVVIQLRKFAEAARSVKAAASANPGSLTRLAQRKPISKERPTLSQDTSELFATDMTDIDTSILGEQKFYPLSTLSPDYHVA